ncbi:MAG: FAD-binding oxidoreductase [Phycisphaerae bacterium]|nr:FAD-binding oxidoreductase [Phycisphaerae bacterium]
MNGNETIIKDLERAIGPDRVLTDATAEAYGADGFAPRVAVVPEDRAQVGEVIRVAGAAGVGVVARGGGTKLGWPPAPSRDVVVLSTERMRTIVQHEPRDLTLTVEAGCVLGDLQTVLGEHRQRLSLDPPLGGRATIGGICAANDSGPLRLGYGAARDLILGMEVIGADGVATRAGARVVKSVAGYDMHRLHIGALGSLGIISEVTFRLTPLAEMLRLNVVRCGDGDRAEACMAAIFAGRTRPTIMELVTPFGYGETVARVGDALIAPSGWTLVVGYEDCREAVEWQCEHLAASMKEVTGIGCVEVLDESGSRGLLEAIREWPGREACIAFKATMKSSQIVPFHAWAGQSGFRLVSHAGSGIAYGRSDDPESVRVGADLAAAAADGGGQLRWTALPAEAGVPVWQPARGDLPVMKRIKQAFDPKGILAPGRWVDGM